MSDEVFFIQNIYLYTEKCVLNHWDWLVSATWVSFLPSPWDTKSTWRFLRFWATSNPSLFVETDRVSGPSSRDGEASASKEPHMQTSKDETRMECYLLTNQPFQGRQIYPWDLRSMSLFFTELKTTNQIGRIHFEWRLLWITGKYSTFLWC